MTNHSGMIPVYLSQMLEPRENDERTWNMMKEGDFGIAKSKTSFTSIGADHQIEQEN